MGYEDCVHWIHVHIHIPNVFIKFLVKCTITFPSCTVNEEVYMYIYTLK